MKKTPICPNIHAAIFFTVAIGTACSSSDDNGAEVGSGGASSTDGDASAGGTNGGDSGAPDQAGSGAGGASSADGGAGGGSNTLAYEPCSADTRVGDFAVDLAPDHPDAPQFTSVLGKVFDGIVPVQVPEIVEEQGGCQLLMNPNFSCDPGCTVSETCSDNGCVAYPVAHDVGTVSIEGLKVAIEMTPSASSKSYSNPARPMLPHPGFDPGASITLDATGGDYEPFELSGFGIEPLQVSADEYVVEEGSPLAIEWTAPANAGPARMLVNLNIDNHGVTSARIECDTEDDGSFEIPSSLVDALIEQGFSGFPTLTLTRRSVDSTNITPGCVEFVVSSELTLGIDLEGLTSCSEDGDCPDGETCQPDLSCG